MKSELRTILACAMLLPLTSPAQIPAGYKGTPFNGPHNVPGRLEAEDFDNGGEGISWHDATSTNQGSSYRDNCNVDIERQYSIGFTENGEWLNYTINVTEDGAYTVRSYCCGPNGNGSFHLEVDGKVVTRSIKAPVVSDWGDFSQCAKATIQLTKGTHLFRWYTYGGMNIDRYEFERTGAYNPDDILGNFNYPVTKPSSNPLFVNFDSPMYGSDGIGSMYTADPSAHVFKDPDTGRDRLYVYASHDMEPANGCDRMDRYHIFSTEDMVNWTDHGEILNSSQVSWGRPDGGFMWAPDCAYRNGTYYFYFPHPSGNDWDSTWKIGIATSSRPADGFTVKGYIDGVPPHIDPCVFIDDDGQAYIYVGGGGHCFGGKLKSNMVELDGAMKEMSGLEDFHEGTWMHKYNGKYYLSYADNHGDDGNQLRYAVSDSPLGPWKSKGAYLYATGCYTSHGSIVEFNGKWYAFYHTSNYSGVGELRSSCFDELQYDSSGNILPVHNWGEPYGGSAVTISPAGITVEAEDYNTGGYHCAYFKNNRSDAPHSNGRATDDVEIAADGARTYVKGMEKGEWLRYSCSVPERGTYDITFRVRGSNNGSFHLSVDGTDKTGALSADNSTAWKTVSVTGVNFPAGASYLDLRFTNGYVDIDNIVITPAEPYKGSAYKNHSIPGMIQAEDFDLGGEGVAFYNGITGNQNKQTGYRTDKADEIADFEKGANLHLCWMNDSKWFKYTFQCRQAGNYTVYANVANQANSSARVKIIIDDKQYSSDEFTGKGWDSYAETVFPDKIYFPAGTNTIEMRTPLNIDYMRFVRDNSSELTDIVNDSSAPEVVSANGEIIIRRYEGAVSIYRTDGTVAYSSAGCPASVKLPAGLYIVALSGLTAKVAVH